MLKSRILITTLFSLVCLLSTTAQDDLMDLFGEEKPSTEFTSATFKTTRVVNSQSVENPASGVLLFIISHHFGAVNSGGDNLYGLDESTIRFGLEYGINSRLTIGAGRSSWLKTVDGFIKYKILRQSTGAVNMPVSLSWFGSTAMNTLETIKSDTRTDYFSSRLAFTHQLLIARKFNNNLSLQLMPTLVHKNLVPTKEDRNDVLAIGAGGRYKLTQRLSFNAEYYYLLPDQSSVDYYNSLSLGFDVETGGHVFQFHFTNSKAMFERGFITETQGQWDKGDIYFGFNITRVFTIRKPEGFKSE